MNPSSSPRALFHPEFTLVIKEIIDGKFEWRNRPRLFVMVAESSHCVTVMIDIVHNAPSWWDYVFILLSLDM